MTAPVRYLLVVAMCLFAVLPGIAAFGPVDRDEARYVQATKQMAESGNYVDIRFQGQPRYKKPIGIYWLQSAFVAASGQGADAAIWVYRLVSAFGIVIACLGVTWTGTRLFGATGGLAAGLVMASIFAVAFEGRIAKTDAFLLACSVLVQGALAVIYTETKSGRTPPRFAPWLFWAAQGVGILIKGPITPLLSGLTILSLFFLDRRDGRWLSELKAARGLLLMLVIVLPWPILITWQSGTAFWQEAIVNDLLGKVGQGQESHGAPPGYYALTYSLFFWPFGALAIGAGLAAMNAMRDDPRLRFLIAWYVPFWLFFELIPTKLPHYVLPAYPALALAIGWLLSGQTGIGLVLKRWQRWVWYLTIFGLVVATLALAAAGLGGAFYLDASVWPWAVAMALLALLAGGAAFPSELVLPRRRVAVAALAACGAYALAFWAVFPRLEPIWLSPRIAAAFEEFRPCGDSVLAAAGYHEPSLVFLVATDTKLTNADGAAQHLAADQKCALAIVPQGNAAAVEASVEKEGGAVRELTRIDGINYSRGRELSLVLLGGGE